jgi:preprotein translocase subunit YajC
MNWFIIIIVGILGIVLIAFLIFRNQKDKKALEKKLNNDYTKPRDEEGDIEINELTG